MFLAIELCTHVKLKCLKKTDYLHKNGFGVKLPTKMICHKTQPTKSNQTYFRRYTWHRNDV